MKRKRLIKVKIVNHIIKHGKKSVGEKIFLKGIKETQKDSKKQAKELIQLAIVNTKPTFKLHIMTNKRQKKKKRKNKEIPGFVFEESSRISLAIKHIVSTTGLKNFSKNFKQELLDNARGTGGAVLAKNNLQQRVIENSRYFPFFRWK